MHNRSKSDTASLTKKRSRLQIVFEILQVCKQPQSRTRIMTEVGLNHNMLLAVLDPLVKHKLIEVSEGLKIKCVISEKGKAYMQKYCELQEISDLSTKEASETSSRI